MNYLKLGILASIIAIATGGIYHGQQHIYNGTIPHVHGNGVVHMH